MSSNFLGWVSSLARTHTRLLAGVAVREGLTRFEAVDAVQEAFATLLGLAQARELAMDGDGAAQLMTVLVRNAARNMRRRHHRARAHETIDAALDPAMDSPSVDALIAAAEEHIALLGCVNQLAEIQRRVVTLRMLEELTPTDTASSVGLTSGHVGVLLHRAKRELIECLERSQ